MRDVDVLLHGEIHDRQRLINALSLATPVVDEVILEALYRRSGPQCVDDLLGEWALAIIDAPQRRVYLSIDFSGSVPLYYAVNARTLICSTDLRRVAESLPQLTVNADYLLGFILGHPELGATPFEEINSVVPGTVVTIDQDSVHTRTTWMPDLSAQVRYRRDEEYEEHFRTVFWSAVGDRVLSRTAVWAELSGGLDSSSIVGVAANILRSHGLSPERLTTVHYCFPGRSSLEDDACCEEVVRATGCRNITMNADGINILNSAEENVPMFPGSNGGIIPPLARAMAGANVRTLLSGEGGDNLMVVGSGWPCPLLPESIRRGDLSAVWHEALGFAKWTHRSVWDVLVNDLVRAPRWRTRPFMVPTRPRWVLRECFEEYNERSRSSRRLPDMSRSTVGSALAFTYVDIARRVIAAQHDRATGSIEPSYPYLDQRLVAFMLAVPFHQKMRPTLGRWLQRRALRTVLPEKVRVRRDKSSGVGFLSHAAQREWDRAKPLISSEMLLRKFGFIDLKLLEQAVEAIRLGGHAGLLPVWKLISVEAWLRCVSAANCSGQRYRVVLR